MQERIQAHREPVPQVMEGAGLARNGAIAAIMDISDGLASEVTHSEAELNPIAATVSGP